MSGTNMLTAPANGTSGDDGGMNLLAGTARQPSIAPGTPSQANTPPFSAPQAVQAQHVAQALQGHSQEQMIEKRDNAGKEMAYLARVMNNPNITRSEVSAYLGGLASQGQISPDELVGILRSLPQQPGQIRQWAQMMFATMMHVGVHGHAAYPPELFPGGQQTQGETQPEPNGEAAPDDGEDAANE
jgi:hypothetical protein